MKHDFQLYTLEEAKAKGLPCEQQKERLCKHCGKQLVWVGSIAKDGFVRWLFTKDCDCEGRREEIKRQEEEEERLREEKAKQAALAKCRKAGIGKLYLGATPSVPECIEYVNSFADAGGKGLYILGNVGAGKTYEACALAKAFVFAGYSVKVATTLSMLNSIHGSYDDSEREGVLKFCEADILFLDDFGKENANSWALTTLFEVINYRYENMLPTIFTSQYSLDALERRLARNNEVESAKAIVSRIHEMSRVVVLRRGDRRRGMN
ncbi:ATP-binding protein [Enteroscipio rubneri]|uniref:ATP-binding protein n=1 Tax=Enteroscipio rubneri TaxID=2070686 RepID=UPI00320BA608